MVSVAPTVGRVAKRRNAMSTTSPTPCLRIGEAANDEASQRQRRLPELWKRPAAMGARQRLDNAARPLLALQVMRRLRPNRCAGLGVGHVRDRTGRGGVGLDQHQLTGPINQQPPGLIPMLR